MTDRINLILEATNSVRFFTDMGETLQAIGVDVQAYDWYVSDVETNKPVEALADGDVWLSGAQLKALLETPGLQFIWGVFSALPQCTRFDIAVSPYADGNPSFWKPPELQPQLRGACFEVDCWDSSATIVVGLTREQANRFTTRFPDAKPLSSAWTGGGS